MCGIAGILDFSSRNVDKFLLKKMTNAIEHRGPDGDGFFVNETGNVGLGHRRLAIIDLSEAGKQPMSFNERFTITFNGEIYNYIELRKELLDKGYEFETESDTEVLLKLYVEYEIGCLQKLEGMFAFVIWDNLKQQLFCARDRFGEKPFFYSFYKNQFIFSSEIKSLFQTALPREVNYKLLHSYLKFNTTQSINSIDETYYKNVKQLRPSHYMLLSKNGDVVNEGRYWDLSLGQNQNISKEEAIEIYRDKFLGSIQRRLRSDVPVGSSLSGGLDSSAIVLTIDGLKSQDQCQKTFSARFKNFERDEGTYMLDVISHGNAIEPFFVWNTADLIVDKIDKVFYHQESPFISPGIIVQNEVMKLAKDNDVTVLLDGQGADEVLGGYYYFYYYYLKDLLRKNPSEYSKQRNAISGFDPSILNRTNSMSFFLDVFAPKIAHMLRSRKFKDENDSFHKEFDDAYNSKEYPFSERSGLSKALYDATLSKGLSDLLKYADRNSMAHSREVRLPFLSHDLVEFTFSLPNSLKINNGWTKYVLRESMKGVVPESVRLRKDKIGYMPPIQRWMSDSRVKDMVNESILHLTEEKIISKPIESKHWNYLMASRLLKMDYN